MLGSEERREQMRKREEREREDNRNNEEEREISEENEIKILLLFLQYLLQCNSKVRIAL